MKKKTKFFFELHLIVYIHFSHSMQPHDQKYRMPIWTTQTVSNYICLTAKWSCSLHWYHVFNSVMHIALRGAVKQCNRGLEPYANWFLRNRKISKNTRQIERRIRTVSWRGICFVFSFFLHAIYACFFHFLSPVWNTNHDIIQLLGPYVLFRAGSALCCECIPVKQILFINRIQRSKQYYLREEFEIREQGEKRSSIQFLSMCNEICWN